MSATHGNLVTHIGTCQVCGRVDVELHRSRSQGLFVCSDAFACFDTWQKFTHATTPPTNKAAPIVGKDNEGGTIGKDRP